MTFTFNGEVITIIGRSHFLVESRTCPGEHHAVDMEEKSCSCRGYLCRNRCRHLATCTALWLAIGRYRGQEPLDSALCAGE